MFLFFLKIQFNLDSDINNNKSEEKDLNTLNTLSEVSIIKNIEQEVTTIDEIVDCTDKSGHIRIDADIAADFKKILEKMNSSDKVVPDAKELQKAVLGKLSKFVRL